MGSSYNAEAEYEAFAKKNYQQLREDIEGALDGSRAGSGKPVLVVIGEMQEQFALSEHFNKMLPDKLQNPPKAVVYPYLSAVQIAEELVDKQNIILSFDLPSDPALKGYCRKMSDISMDMQRGIVPFAGYLAGHMMEEGYRVSFDDMGYQLEAESPERFQAEIDEIVRLGSFKKSTADVIIHFGKAEYIGVWQGHDFEDLLENGRGLMRHSAADPFADTFSASLYYNGAYSRTARLETWIQNGFGEAVDYAMNPINAEQLELPPGAMPDGHGIADILKDVRQASEEYNFAQKNEAGANQPVPVRAGVASMKL